MDRQLKDKLDLAERTARAAGAMLLEKRDVHVQNKGHHDFVTEMDFALERFIRESLLSAYPEDGFYGEETGGDGACGGRWIVDPIDGTTNFIRRIPQYSISIAYEQNGDLVLGAVFAPALNEMFLGLKGHGATLNGKPISVSQTVEASDALIAMSFAHRNSECNRRMLALLPELSRSVNDLRRIGSAAVDLCYTACGRVDAFIELDLKLYDIAAGMVIVREAGGLATGWPGEADATETGNILAATPCIHAWLSEYLRGSF